MELLFLAVSLFSSIIGAICGIGGGVIMKPILDATGVLSVSAVSFLSGCSVLTMSVISVGGNLTARREIIRDSTPLAVGAALGGLLGKAVFQYIIGMFGNDNIVGFVQSGIMLLLTLGALLYTVKKDSVTTRKVGRIGIQVIIGLLLGVISAFLGIGGGAVNIIILCYFFSMGTKAAGAVSLYIIMLSQLTGLLSTLIMGKIPDFQVLLLVIMVAGGMLGGYIGNRIHKKIPEKQAEKFFMVVMIAIIIINLFNMIRFGNL